jgi:hypothetical protein
VFIAQQLMKLYVKFVSKRNMKLDNAVWHLFLRQPGEDTQYNIQVKLMTQKWNTYLPARKVRAYFAYILI